MRERERELVGEVDAALAVRRVRARELRARRQRVARSAQPAVFAAARHRPALYVPLAAAANAPNPPPPLLPELSDAPTFLRLHHCRPVEEAFAAALVAADADADAEAEARKAPFVE